MKLAYREVLKVNGASGIDRKALEGWIISVAFIYSGTTNSNTNAEVFEQVDNYRKPIASNDASATNTSFPLGNQSKDATGTDTGHYIAPLVAGDVVLEVDSADANQVTKVYLWMLK